MALQELLEGAAQSVREVFGEDVEIYLGRAEQGVKRPCIFLEAEEGERRPLPCKREELVCTVTADYLPRKNEDTPRAAVEQLTQALAVVQVKDGPILRGIGTAGEVKSGRAQASARYRLVLSQKEEAHETMDAVSLCMTLHAPDGETDDTETEE